MCLADNIIDCIRLFVAEKFWVFLRISIQGKRGAEWGKLDEENGLENGKTGAVFETTGTGGFKYKGMIMTILSH